MGHQFIYMANELDENEKAAAEAPIEITDEVFEQQLLKRFGVTSADIKKPIETEEQRKLAEAKEKEEDINFALKEGIVSAEDYKEYIQALSEDKVELARKKFIRENSDLGDKATDIFNRLMRQDEDDEIEDGENFIPNPEKAAANKLLAQMVEEENEKKFGKFKTLGEARKNTQLITEVVNATPKRVEMEIAGVSFGVNVSDEDIQAAKKIALTGMMNKGLTKEGVEATIQATLQTMKRTAIIEEGIKVLVAAELEANKRGVKGIIDDKGKVISGISPKMKKMIDLGYITPR